jgi:predicted outer membrane repeat protein
LIRSTIFIIAVLFGFGNAEAGGIVTKCSTESQPGPGLNLVDAIASGGGVGFQCNGQVIHVTHTLRISRPLDIDGGNGSALAADAGVPMFAADPAARLITIRNIELTGGSNVTFGSIFDGTAVDLELINANVHNAGHTNGSVYGFVGGAVIRASSIHAQNSTFSKNTGTVLMAPSMTIEGSDFDSNLGQPFMPSSVDDGGVLTVNNSTFEGNGVSVWRAGDVTIRGCDFFDNANPSGYGGALTFRGKASIEKTTFRKNTALSGGAIWFSAGQLALNRVTFENNTASEDGGAVGVPRNTSDTAITTRYSHFRGNKAQSGGAISIPGSGNRSLTGFAVNFARNTASNDGGAIFADSVAIDLVRAQMVDNQAGQSGGAINVTGLVEARLANALIARNQAQTGAAFSGSRVRFINATIADNKGTAVGLLPQRGAVAALANTIVLNNSGGNCALADGRLDDGGHNVQFPGTDCGPGIVSGDPGLDGMYVPVPNSPVRFGGDISACTSPPINGRDIFNANRPQTQGKCTIGAIERSIEPQAIDTLRHSDVPAKFKDFLNFLNLSRTRSWKPQVVSDH